MKVPSLAILAAVCLMQLYTAAPNPRPDIKSTETKGIHGIKKGYPLKDFNNGLSEAAKINQHDQIEPIADSSNQITYASSLYDRPVVNSGVETASADDSDTDDSAVQDLRIGLGIASTLKDDVTETDGQQPEDKQENGIASTQQPPDTAPADDLRVGLGIASTLKDPSDVDISNKISTDPSDVVVAGLHESPAVSPDTEIAGSADQSNQIQGNGISSLHERPAVNKEIDMKSNDEQPQGIGISGLHERPAIKTNNTNANDRDNQGIGIAALHERPSVSEFTPNIGLGMASMHERPEMEQKPGRGITNPGVGISALQDRPPLHEQDIQMDALNETIKLDIWQTMSNEEDASVTVAKMNDSIYQDLLSLTTPGTEFTVFAPSNTAWDDMPEDVQIALNGPLENVVTNSLLQYHIVPDVKITSNQILGYESKIITTMSGYSLRIFNVNGTLKVNGLHMKKADIMASNGVLHIIDRVLVPTHP